MRTKNENMFDIFSVAMMIDMLLGYINIADIACSFVYKMGSVIAEMANVALTSTSQQVIA